ncbi:heme exporter protein CcmD [Ramlibacter sp. USB13]|uniref:Heme exporter protein D n=1 Tax=Ramlibacter cellulosilyticus TaxID=2764187 RepID=A0A923MRZ6_9BURK|nr:heme exporter protein CcmD [Ramlibacter cellulosilyticus]MBC5784110.1 heme exporter protein CcmD [Ramlibacter cellulosilyticus]
MSIDWTAFWQLGGHGIYVWPGYMAAAVLVALEAAWLLRRLRSGGPEDDA